MGTWDLVGLVSNGHDAAGDVLLTEALWRVVAGERRAQILEDTCVIDDEAERLLRRSLFVEDAVYPGDSLQETMFLQTASQIEHRVAWRIEAREQFVYNDDDVRIGWPFELLNDGPVIGLLTAMALHHL